jgi:hypothetical protein
LAVREFRLTVLGISAVSRVLFFAVDSEGRKVSSGEIASDLTNRRNGFSD